MRDRATTRVGRPARGRSFRAWRLDDRGTFGRGCAFETPIFGELGEVALQDQLAGIDYLRPLPYVDATDAAHLAAAHLRGLDDTNVHLQNAENLIDKLEAIHRPFSFLPLPNTDHAIHGEALATVLMASTLRAGDRGEVGSTGPAHPGDESRRTGGTRRCAAM